MGHPDKEFKDYLTHGMQYGSESVSIPHSHYKLPAPTCPPLDCIQYDQNVVQEYLDHEGRAPGYYRSPGGTRQPFRGHSQKAPTQQVAPHSIYLTRTTAASTTASTNLHESIDDAARIVWVLAKIDIAVHWITTSGVPSSLIPLYSPKIFCAIADTLEWIFFKRGVSTCLHYIDDFFFFFFTAGCQQNLGHIIGIPLAQHKIEGPVTVMGIEIDTDHYYADKLCRLQLLVTSWTSRKAATKREMLPLIGQLSHARQILLTPAPVTTWTTGYVLTSRLGQTCTGGTFF